MKLHKASVIVAIARLIIASTYVVILFNRDALCAGAKRLPESWNISETNADRDTKLGLSLPATILRNAHAE